MKRETALNEKTIDELYNEAIEYLKNYLFDSAKSSKERSAVNDFQSKITDLMSQLGEPIFPVILALNIFLFRPKRERLSTSDVTPTIPS